MKIKMTRTTSLTLSVLLLASTSGVASAEGLRDALAAAYLSNPDLEAQRAALRSTDEGLVRATAGFMPSITGTSQYQKSNTSGTGQTQVSAGDIRTFPTDTDATQEFWQARVDQNLFNGFQTTNGRKEARNLMEAGRAQLLSVEQQTLLNAVTAYMDVVRDNAVLSLNNNQVQVLERQLQASRDRFRVGEVTRTDVAQSEARLAGARSAMITAEANLATSRATYRQIIGDMPGTLDEPPALPPLPASVDDAMVIALDANPAIELARYNERAADNSVDRTKGTLLPSVSAFASISRSDFNGTDKTVNPFLDTVTNSTVKTIGIQAQWNLYQGGAEYADIRQAKQVRSQRRMQVLAADRLVRANVLSSWESYRAAQGTIQSNQSQVRANEIALEGVRQEASVGSRTTLDVLDAEQELLDARVNLVRAERNEYVAGFTLLAAMGQLNAMSLDLPVELYDPDEYYRDVRWQFIGWGTD